MVERRYSPLWELTKARAREFYREPGAVFWVFVFPVLLAIGLGIAFRSRPPEVPRIVVAAAPQAGALVDQLRGGSEIEPEQLDLQRALVKLGRGEVDLVVELCGQERLCFHLDPDHPQARVARLHVELALGRQQGADLPMIEERPLTRAGSRYIDFLLPGLIGLNLMGSSMFGIGYAVVMSRKRRQLKRFAATPMRRTHYLLAFMFSRLLFMLAEVAALVLFGYLVFDVQVHGSLPAVGAISGVGAFSFAGLALLMAARTESVEVASGWMNFAQLPMYVLSGAFFSYERFPEAFHLPIRLLPLTALNDALREVMNHGGGLTSTWPELLVLALWGGMSFALALSRFAWK